jgi:hypothetical protein
LVGSNTIVQWRRRPRLRDHFLKAMPRIGLLAREHDSACHDQRHAERDAALEVFLEDEPGQQGRENAF